MGEWKATAGLTPGAGHEKDLGISTSEDARFYSLTAPLSSSFDNKDKPLVISYTVKQEKDVDCGGAYIKVRRGVCCVCGGRGARRECGRACVHGASSVMARVARRCVACV